jgi:hypothetical protein
MQRLIVFGASSAYGVGLPDASFAPSKFAWPQVLANKLKYECVNKSVPGCSNIHILNDLLNFEFNESDTVIIDWMFKERDTVFETSRHIGSNDSEMSLLLSIFSNYDFCVRTWMIYHHAYLHLKSKNVKFYFIEFWEDQGLIKNKPAWANEIKMLECNMAGRSQWLPKAPDGHPGKFCHWTLAYTIHKQIK